MPHGCNCADQAYVAKSTRNRMDTSDPIIMPKDRARGLARKRIRRNSYVGHALH